MPTKKKTPGMTQTEIDFKVIETGEKQGREAVAKMQAMKQMERMEINAVRREEDVNKAMLLDREKENFTQILALKCANGWLKVYDNSAMIVSTWLDGRLGRRYERNDDGGYGKRAEYGVVSIPPESVKEFVQRLDKAGIPLKFDDIWIMEFTLGERVTKEEMVRMLHEDELIVDKVNQLVMPKETLPVLRAAVKSLLDFIHTQVQNQRDSVKDVFLNDVERLAVKMDKAVIATARGRMKLDKCLEEIGWSAEEMYENATVMSDMKLITAKQYKKFYDVVRKVDDEQARAIKRQAIAAANEKIVAAKKK